MYEAVYATPEGRSTVARFAHTASEYGFSGLVVRSGAACGADDAEAIAESTGIDVVHGTEIRAEGPQKASGYLGDRREEYTVLALRGGTNELNRFAVEQERLDVLTKPMAGEGDFNHVLAKAAARNGVRVEFDLSTVLRLEGGPRVQALSDMRKLRELVGQYDAPYVVSGAPESHLQLRGPRELVAVGERVGFSAEEIEHGLREWGRLTDRNREVVSESFIEPGVRRGRYEENG
ncbi:RNase P subunit p30 family protein [Halalkalicoccus jeotgali]|uniref:Ribonuclease P protein component 3 n=1 Tax=Halalkalicoccus jeotgali (strain DSM 18796 / CECT 7217 / JCM 14584 / KCTC 4019 / B3) TaxID=795797 RepID=D8J2N3_HALJB|nr:RNase P subunit p30 family protein [Halalkalicoccus jeotgali]ADJ14990.1 Ribonuclease P [Halalkalicoccus jeotgali B3]ELY34994.1 Ribonuclease P [Halalkalicoccus jeotgali B3]